MSIAKIKAINAKQNNGISSAHVSVYDELTDTEEIAIASAISDNGMGYITEENGVLPETTINAEDWDSGSTAASYDLPTKPFSGGDVGKNYRVVWDGVNYIRTLTERGGNYVLLGNSSIETYFGMEYTGEPFLIAADKETNGSCYVYIPTNDVGSHTISISEVSVAQESFEFGCDALINVSVQSAPVLVYGSFASIIAKAKRYEPINIKVIKDYGEDSYYEMFLNGIEVVTSDDEARITIQYAYRLAWENNTLSPVQPHTISWTANEIEGSDQW